MVVFISVSGGPGDLWFGLYCNMPLSQHVNDEEQNHPCTNGSAVSGHVVSNTILGYKSVVIMKHGELKCLSGVQISFFSDFLTRNTTSEGVCLLILTFY